MTKDELSKVNMFFLISEMLLKLSATDSVKVNAMKKYYQYDNLYGAF